MLDAHVAEAWLTALRERVPLLSITERIYAYADSPHGRRYPDSVPVLSSTGRKMYGRWELGNDYRSTSTLYGAYPARYLERVLALFPSPGRVLHVFSGSVPVGPWVRVDLSPHRTPAPDVVATVLALPFAADTFDLVLADPPYSAPDAARYSTPMVNRLKALAAIASVVKPGGHLVWLDTQVPMFTNRTWRWWGAVSVFRSTNHRVREASFFERVAPC